MPPIAKATGDISTPMADARTENAMPAPTNVPPMVISATPRPPTPISAMPTTRTSCPFSFTKFFTAETPALTIRIMPAKSSSSSPPTAAATSMKVAFNAFIWLAKLPLVRTASPCAAVVPRMMMFMRACAFCASVAVFGSRFWFSSS